MNYIETVSGNLVDLDNPVSHTILIYDIAWVLSRTGRMNGHTISEIQPNNADHSILVAEYMQQHIKKFIAGELDGAHTALFEQYVKEIGIENFGKDSYKDYELVLKALLHDAAEYITGDIPSPVKRITGIKDLLADLEDKIESCIYIGMNMPRVSTTEKKLIKIADMYAQRIEQFNYLRSRGDNYDWAYEFKIGETQYITPIKMSTLDLSVFREPRLAKESFIHFMDYYTNLYNTYRDRVNTAVSKEQIELLYNAFDNLSDRPVSDSWAEEWTEKVKTTIGR